MARVPARREELAAAMLTLPTTAALLVVSDRMPPLLQPLALPTMLFLGRQQQWAGLRGVGSEDGGGGVHRTAWITRSPASAP